MCIPTINGCIITYLFFVHGLYFSPRRGWPIVLIFYKSNTLRFNTNKEFNTPFALNYEPSTVRSQTYVQLNFEVNGKASMPWYYSSTIVCICISSHIWDCFVTKLNFKIWPTYLIVCILNTLILQAIQKMEMPVFCD